MCSSWFAFPRNIELTASSFARHDVETEQKRVSQNRASEARAMSLSSWHDVRSHFPKESTNLRGKLQSPERGDDHLARQPNRSSPYGKDLRRISTPSAYRPSSSYGSPRRVAKTLNPWVPEKLVVEGRYLFRRHSLQNLRSDGSACTRGWGKNSRGPFSGQSGRSGCPVHRKIHTPGSPRSTRCQTSSSVRAKIRSSSGCSSFDIAVNPR